MNIFIVHSGADERRITAIIKELEKPEKSGSHANILMLGNGGTFLECVWYFKRK